MLFVKLHGMLCTKLSIKLSISERNLRKLSLESVIITFVPAVYGQMNAARLLLRLHKGWPVSIGNPDHWTDCCRGGAETDTGPDERRGVDSRKRGQSSAGDPPAQLSRAAAVTCVRLLPGFFLH